MKTNIKNICTTGIAVLGLLCACETYAQEQSSNLQAGEKGADFQQWQRVETIRDAKGNLVSKTNLAYLEMETGKHYREGENWLESREFIEAFPGGAIARQGEHKVIFAENFNSDVVIDLETRDGKRLRSRVLGLSYLDSASGRSVLLAEAISSAGKIVGDNQVIYSDAFSGVKADVRYTYTKAGLEQDVILRERPAAPESYGLDSKTTKLQVLTEFLSPPTPEITTRTSGKTDGDTDETLSFGKMQMGAGKAFAIGLGDVPTEKIPVAKQWRLFDGRTILIEEASVSLLAKQFDSLPAKKRTAFLWDKKATRQTAALKLNLPVRGATKPLKRQMQTAKLSTPIRGLVLDYVLLTSQNNFTFKGDTTYYVSGAVNLSGLTTIEGGAVVKFSSSTTATISVQSISCPTNNYQVAVFTAKDDDSVGDVILGSTHNPTTSNYGGGIYGTASYESEPSYSNLRFSFLRMGIHYEASYPEYDNFYIWNVQAVSCITFLDLTHAQAHIENGLFHNVNNFILSHEATTIAEHVTLDHCGITAGQGITGNWFNYVTFVNSLLVESTYESDGGGWFDGTWENNSPNLSFASGVFHAAVGAGSHYLADNSPFRNTATDPINPKLAAQLKTKTTFPPTVFQNTTFTANKIFSPRAQRDLDAPDIGYHYDRVDYFFGGALASSALTFTEGTVVGWFELPAPNRVRPYGIGLNQGGIVNLNGSACDPCTVVRYEAIQERGNGAWTDRGSLSAISGDSSCVVNAEFTHFVALAGDPDHFRDNGGSFNVTVKHSEFLNGGVSGLFSIYNFTNCLFERSFLRFESDYFSTDRSLALQNCTMRAGTFEFQGYWNTTVWTVSVLDSAFDATVINYGDLNLSTDSIVNCDYNAFLTGSGVFWNSGGHDRTISTFNWQSGSLGKYYLPVTSDLINHGSAISASLGLDTFTTQVSLTPDVGTVDIGFHYALPPITCCPLSGGDSIWVDGSPLPQQLAEWIMASAGAGVTVVPGSANFTGAVGAVGVFRNGTTAGLAINKGVILTSGQISRAPGPNNRTDASPSEPDNNRAGDSDLNTLNLTPGFTTTDAAVLSFDITCSSQTTISFDYIFASEEYSEWIGQFNDLFAIFIQQDNGQKLNVALVPSTTDIIAVNTIHNGGGQFQTIPPKNPQFYQNNEPQVVNVQYDGLTAGGSNHFLTTNTKTVVPNSTYHIKIAIADASHIDRADHVLDSAVFIKAQVPCQ